MLQSICGRAGLQPALPGWERGERALKNKPSVSLQDRLHLLGGIVTQELNFGALKGLIIVSHVDHEVGGDSR